MLKEENIIFQLFEYFSIKLRNKAKEDNLVTQTDKKKKDKQKKQTVEKKMREIIEGDLCLLI